MRGEGSARTSRRSSDQARRTRRRGRCSLARFHRSSRPSRTAGSNRSRQRLSVGGHAEARHAHAIDAHLRGRAHDPAPGEPCRRFASRRASAPMFTSGAIHTSPDEPDFEDRYDGVGDVRRGRETAEAADVGRHQSGVDTARAHGVEPDRPTAECWAQASDEADDRVLRERVERVRADTASAPPPTRSPRCHRRQDRGGAGARGCRGTRRRR